MKCGYKPKDLGILFRPELYTAIVEGRKTETRRLAWPNGGLLFDYDENGEVVGSRVNMDRGWARMRKGDTLWVREKLIEAVIYEGAASFAKYARDGAEPSPPCIWRWSRNWLSPLHMPREAARLRLRLVEDARAERVEDIDNAGAMREGVRAFGAKWGFSDAIDDVRRNTPRDAFLALWDKVHPSPALGHREHVVVLRFEVANDLETGNG